MEETFGAERCSLHVRVTNRAAFTLYSETLGFEINDVEKGYYADKEDAYDMRKMFATGLKKQEASKAKKKDKDAVKDKGKDADPGPQPEAKAEAKAEDEGAKVVEGKDGEEAKDEEKKKQKR